MSARIAAGVALAAALLAGAGSLLPDAGAAASGCTYVLAPPGAHGVGAARRTPHSVQALVDRLRPGRPAASAAASGANR